MELTCIKNVKDTWTKQRLYTKGRRYNAKILRDSEGKPGNYVRILANDIGQSDLIDAAAFIITHFIRSDAIAS